MILKTMEDFVRIYGPKVVSVVQSCDGSRSLAEIAEESKIPIETLLFVAKQMVLEGLLEVQQY